ncbi:ATP-dependent endonuclease [Chromobacterium sp.]|uniref:ATP-dependent nuclease n=1 Tax=Chromobacterium sp. TaxID=306190 RepID=UPI0035B35E8D
MKKKFQVVSVEAENLRGYQNTILQFKELTILVGENNEGKSSLLKMFDKVLNGRSLVQSNNELYLSPDELAFWYPANSQNHKARRFTLNLNVLDGNFGRKYGVKKGGNLSLRFSVNLSDGAYRLNYGPPRRSEKHDLKAVELLKEVQKSTKLIFLPPVRDAGSSKFSEKITNSVRHKVQNKISHSRQAGSPKEYRIALEIIEKFKKIIEMNSQNIGMSNQSPLSGMMIANEVRVNLKPSDVGRLLDNALHLYVSTGNHDEKMVLPTETGNGLQSLIDIDLTIDDLNKTNKSIAEVIVVIEEPEAFLHPSAQRQFMHYLRNTLSSKVDKAVLTTHSPVIVDEANYGEIVLVRKQKHFHPAFVDETRNSINSSLMSVASSEIFFARTVVFVEGEGDRALFNCLLKRIAEKTGYFSLLRSIVIQPTGGCKNYAPWFSLVDSYSVGHNRPIKSVWIMDADAASASTQRALLVAFRNSGRQVKSDVDAVIKDFGDKDWLPETRSVKNFISLNHAISSLNGLFFSCDLEWAIFNESSLKVVNEIKSVFAKYSINSQGASVDLARRLGSKINLGTSSDGSVKAPHVRADIAMALPLDNLPPEIDFVITRMLQIALDDASVVKLIRKKMGASETIVEDL